MIPASRVNAVGRNILSYLPLPSRTGPTDSFNFTGSDTLTDRADEYTAKVDHELLSWWKLNASYMHYKSREPGGNTLGTLPGGSNASPFLLFRKVDATAINSVMTLNPTTVLNLRYGFNRFPNFTQGISYGFSPATLGFPTNYVSALQAQYFPQIDFLNNSISNVSPNIPVFWSKNLLGSVSKFAGRHNMTAGMDYRLIHTDFASLANAAGAFSFNGVFSRQYPNQATANTGADFADVLLGAPSSGVVSTTTKLYTYVRYYSGYFQDDFRVNNKLTVNVGLRYEYETGIAEKNNRYVVGFDQNAASPLAANVTGVLPVGAVLYAGQKGNSNTCCSPSKTKFGPRAGVAYQLTPKTTLRGGWGIFYAPTYFTSDATLAVGYTQATTYVASNDGNATPANSLSNPFPNGVLQPVGNSLGALAGVGGSINYLDQKRTSGLVHQYSFDIQQELPFKIGFELGYIGSISRHLQQSSTSSAPMNINQVPSNYLALGSKLSGAVANPFFGHGGTGIIGNATVAQAQLLLPFPQFGTVGQLSNQGRARYDSMVAKVQKKYTSGFTFLGTFTWSKNYDNTFGTGNFFSSTKNTPQDYYNLGAEWGLAVADVSRRFTATTSYDLPFGKGKQFLNGSKILDYAVGGWQINATIVYQTGFPLTIYQTSNLNSVIGTGEQRPNATGISPEVSGSVESRLNEYINPAAFSPAPAYTFGNLSRTIPYRGPGMKNWDTSLFKNFKILERVTGQFRAEALNTFNSPLFPNPNTSCAAGSASFGKITSQINFSRLIQLGVRFYF